MKCQGWNHFTKECTEKSDKCGNCAGDHRTTHCSSSECKCVSCNTNEHASWSCNCPTFIKKTEEFNSRNPENSHQYFPTAKSWTWMPSNIYNKKTAPHTFQHTKLPTSNPPNDHQQLEEMLTPISQNISEERTHTSLTTATHIHWKNKTNHQPEEAQQ